MHINNLDIESIVKQVIATLDIENIDTSSSALGVFDNVNQAIDAAYTAQKTYQQKNTLADRNKIIAKIRQVCTENKIELARMVVDETGLGRFDDKIAKHTLVIEKTPGTEALETKAASGDSGLMIEEASPYGLIGAITPVTNPTETIINNTISMIAGGNGVVFNVHPSAKNCCAYVVRLLNQAIIDSGGPANLITMVKEPNMDTVNIISNSPRVRMLVGTGGMGLVNALLKSGKKVIGAGAGNPPVLVDETADLKLAAEQIYFGASFDNNIICLAEKEVFAHYNVVDQLITNFISCGAYLLSDQELEKLTSQCFTKDDSGYHVVKDWVGQDASKILAAAGINVPSDCKLAIAKTELQHPFVLTEQMMPILPIVSCSSFDQMIDHALTAEKGNRHTASIFSQNINNITTFGKAIETTIFVKNAATLAGVGYNGEGFSTMTIAGPTGEGITCAQSFTRKRRCVLSDGGFRII